MANTDAKRGLDIILTINDNIVGGQRNATLNREAETIDITNKVSGGWTESMTSVKSWSIEGNGIFVVNDTALDAIETAFLNGDWVQVKVADDTWGYTGLGVITDFPIEANYDDAATYSITITGSGALTKITNDDDDDDTPDPTPTVTYTAVTPIGTENPVTEGWYEKNGEDYVLSEDTTVNASKTYYERTENI